MKPFIAAALIAPCCVLSHALDLRIDHAFGPGAQFETRGTVTLNIDSAKVSQPTTVPPAGLGPNASRMEDLIRANELYMIRVAADHAPTDHIVAAVPSCHLRLASFREEITLHIDWNGHIVGMDYKAPVGPLASTRDCTKMPVSETSQVITNVRVVRPATAKSVPLQIMANGPPPGLMNLKDNVGKQDPKAASNQSILVKYWYIFVPMLVMWMMSPSPPDQAGAAGSNGPVTAAQGPPSGGSAGGR